MEFQSIKELKLRVLPALRLKSRELYEKHKIKVSEDDIFDALKESKWKKEQGLTLADIVDDILKYSLEG